MLCRACRAFLISCAVPFFGKCQNLGGNDEKYYTAAKQFCKVLQFVHCNYHKFIFANQ